jgi:hypothetical protein
MRLAAGFVHDLHPQGLDGQGAVLEVDLAPARGADLPDPAAGGDHQLQAAGRESRAPGQLRHEGGELFMGEW